MTDISDRYARLADAFTAKVAAVSEDQWANPSPCEEWTARDIVGHVIDTQGMFLGFVGREMEDHPSVDDDPEGAVRAVTGRIRKDLEDPTLAAETFEGFLGTQRFEEAVDRFLSADLIVHGWDLAKATGQATDIADGDVADLRKMADSFPEEAMRSPGAFGPAVEVADHASEQDKILAHLGRRA
jgi:uncharacterized protein (TIGR03086 family)